MPIISSSTSAFYERSRTNMKDLRKEAEKLQAQLGSGQKLSRSSDNPVAASRLRTLSRQESISSIDTTNANRANADLSLADSAMSSMGSAIIRAQELAGQASNSTLTDEQRGAIAVEMDQIFQDLVALANSRASNGQALFGGEAAGDAYSIDASGNAVYIGTASSGDLPIGDGQTVGRSMTGPQILNFTDANGNATDILSTIKALSNALKGGVANPAGAASDSLDVLRVGLDNLTTSQTVVGTRLAWLDVVADRRVEISELRDTEQADLGSTDIPSTVAQLQETMTVLEASQASFTRLANLSLFDNLR
jgi:Flagellin and related hook-associated proteins